ncbi:hypothetical protein DFH28DRAFT_1124257 [Melampsora americana]|nr:hypothetical protein DFH28DRAFT_1126420 [Melampsora americana]KAH9815130.1 hypothetical protein DFH28DRAFT_1126501 [Melampsora americana]KAH9817607.1 hypothetical protein DFH28DRAFT_1124257 [Melampsora americana]
MGPYQFHRPVFLPVYILEFVSEGAENEHPHFDLQSFLSQASTSQLLEMISLIYPHVEFSQEARDDDALVKKIYLDTVAPNLCNLFIPKGLKPVPFSLYFQAKIEVRTFADTKFDIYISKENDVDTGRILQFNCLIRCYLENGQHGIAAHNLADFITTHKYLNKYELGALEHAYSGLVEGLEETQRFVQDSHREIVAIGFQLSDPDATSDHRQELRRRLETVHEKLQVNEKLFATTIQAVGFMDALMKHHQALALKNKQTPNSPVQSP